MITVEEVMTKTPTVISKQWSLDEAASLMRKSEFRHLPVVDLKGNVVGVVSERDLRLAIMLPGTSNTVEDVMTPNPYLVSKETPVSTIIAQMRSQKFGAAVVVDDIGLVCGIFTVTDALALLASLTKQA
jgi:CBS domain-containing protein